ncbi:MAG: SDR family oxidoreductase [Acidobacteria bacterium]|nr:SDR family oxidoreductase [Acidobacteriota bacterium]
MTGASRGIGKGIAQALAAEGARVLLVARNREALEAVRAELPGGADAHRCFALDLTAEGGISDLVTGIQAEAGDPPILVHNLGGSHGVFQAMASSEDWRKVWQFNVGIAHELNRIFLPAMVAAKWGRVVHLSTLSTRTHNGYAPYVSAKCALDGYVKSVNRDVSRHNVVLTAVAPGAIFSEGRHFAKLAQEDPAALDAYYKEHLPIQRLGQPSDIGPVVAFLCSDYAAFMAGAIVGVDGGGM